MTRVRLADNAVGTASGRDLLIQARIGRLRALNPRAFSSAPVRVMKTRQNQKLEPPFRFNRNGKGSRPSQPGDGTAPQVEGLSDNKMKGLVGDLAWDPGHPHLFPKTGELA